MTNQERKEEKQLNRQFRQKYGELTPISALKYQKRSKKQRQAWWRNLSPEQQAAYIEKRQAQKSELRAATNHQSTCPVFPEITAENRQQWLDKLQKLNPWLPPLSIAQEAR